MFAERLQKRTSNGWRVVDGVVNEILTNTAGNGR